MVSSESRHDSVGGGGSSRNCPWSPKADVIQWGGEGGSSRNFPWSPEADVIQWGGVVAEINFPWSPKPDVIQWGGG